MSYKVEESFERLTPAFKENNIPILFAANVGFLPYVAVMIQSIAAHSSEKHNYDIVVLHSGIPKEDRHIFIDANKYANFSIRFFDMSFLCSSYNFYTGIRDGRLTQEAYFRLFAGQVLSDEYDKAIYLDGDMVALTDMAELYKIDITGYYLAAPRDVTGISYCYKPGNDRLEYRVGRLGLKNPDDYFIDGLVIFNLELLRRDFPGKKLIDLAASRNWLQHDQDVLNYISNDGMVKVLHPAWNVLEDYGNNIFLPPLIMQEWLESEKAPLVIHYGGSGKPWKKEVPRQHFFWQYAARTSYFEKIVLNMLEEEQRYSQQEKHQLRLDIENVRQKIVLGAVEPTRSQIFAELAWAESQRRNLAIPDEPLISVIVTVYKVEPYLEKCIESVINQTYRNLEIILVDDGSPDRCGAICDKYAAQDNRIKVVHQKNGGVSEARNAGLALATGDYIGWVDGDDWISVDMYEYLINGAKRYKTPVVICGFVNVRNGNFSSDYRKADSVLSVKETLDQLFHFKIRNYLYDKLWERWLFEGLQFDKNVVFEDTRVVYKLFEQARWVALLKTSKYYRLQREDSIVNNYSVKNKLNAVQANMIRYSDIKERWPVLRNIHLLECYRAIQRLRQAIANSPRQDYNKFAAEIKAVVEYLRENHEVTLGVLQVGLLGRLEYSLMSLGGRVGFVLSNLPVWLIEKKQRLVDFNSTGLKKTVIAKFKAFGKKIFPAYRVGLRLEERLIKVDRAANKKNVVLDSKTETVFWLQNVQPDETMEETKKRVFLEMPKWGGEISLLQKGNGYLLKRLKAICQEHDITFWLIGGTLLGALRHRGFIPWDDDIDVGIMRDDLERLKQVMKSYKDLRLERYYHTPGRWQTIKLMFAIEESPFWVDLLVYDYAGDDSMKPEILWKQIQSVRNKTKSALNGLKQNLKLVYRDDIVYDQKDAEQIDMVYGKNLLVLPAVLQRKYIYRSIDNVCAGWQQLFPCERIMPFCELEFEGENYLAPKDYEWYLHLQFGDYMSIPKDVGHTHTRFTEGKMENAEAILKNLGL